MKKGGAEGNLTKAARRRQNKMKKKAEEDAKQAEIEAVKRPLRPYYASFFCEPGG